MDINTILKMANTKSLIKVVNYLKEKGDAVSPSEICIQTKLRWSSVKDILGILAITNQITLMATEKNRTLVQYKGEVQNATG